MMPMKPKLSMQVEMTAYGVLGVPEQASTDAIHLAYRRIAQIYHDKATVRDDWTDPWPERVMKIASSAKEMLLDPTKRAAYDQLLHMKRNGLEPQPEPETVHAGATEGPEIVPRHGPGPIAAFFNNMSQFVDPDVASSAVELIAEHGAEQVKKWLERNMRGHE